MFPSERRGRRFMLMATHRNFIARVSTARVRSFTWCWCSLSSLDKHGHEWCAARVESPGCKLFIEHRSAISAQPNFSARRTREERARVPLPPPLLNSSMRVLFVSILLIFLIVGHSLCKSLYSCGVTLKTTFLNCIPSLLFVDVIHYIGYIGIQWSFGSTEIECWMKCFIIFIAIFQLSRILWSFCICNESSRSLFCCIVKPLSLKEV